jgi:putative transposase
MPPIPVCLVWLSSSHPDGEPRAFRYNPLERLNKEVKRRADVVGIFPNEDSIVRLIGAVLLEANDEWQLQHRYMQVEAMADLNPPITTEEKPLQITPKAA